MTAEELSARGPSDRVELIRGEVVELSPTGLEHGRFISKVATAFVFYPEKNSIGEWVTGETGFILERDPDTVRAPDLALMGNENSPARPHPKFGDGAPTIAVDVISPGDRLAEVMSQADQWLSSGCTSVWLIDPQREKATICRLVDAAAWLMVSFRRLTPIGLSSRNCCRDSPSTPRHSGNAELAA